MILLENETYALEPVPQSATNNHLLYLLKDVQSQPFTCGVINEAASSTHSHEHFNPGQTLSSLLRVRRTATCTHICIANRCKVLLNKYHLCLLFQQRKRNLPQTSYVELVLVVDNLRVGANIYCFTCGFFRLIRNDALLLPCLNFQYNFKKQNETAVREEVVELGNLLDGVRI